MWFASRRTLISRGLVTIAFGLLLVIWPTMSFEVFVLLFGAFALVDGVLIITTLIRTPPGEPGRVLGLCAGTLAIALGVATFVWPGLTEMALIILMGLRALLIGAAEMVTAVWLKRYVGGVGVGAGAGLVGCVGLISLAFGVFLLVYPGVALVALVWAIGSYAILLGLLAVARAWLVPLPRQIPISVPH